jgi:putative nucleotidyltransferase with HDIG domain
MQTNQASVANLKDWRFQLLNGVVSVGAGFLFFVHGRSSTWTLEGAPWLGLVAFAVLGIACEAFFLQIGSIRFTKIATSVAFIPLIAAVFLFEQPLPMVISGITAVIVEVFVRHKTPVRAWFNTAQYMLGIGLGGVVYQALGGHVGSNPYVFNVFSLLPSIGLVLTFFVVNQGSVSLAVAFTGRVPIRESWAKVVGGSLIYDLVASSLAVALAALYSRYQLPGLAVLIVPLFLVRHMYQMMQRVERVNRELLELMVKAIEARDPYTSGHSLRVSEYARTIAREMGLSAKLVEQTASAALLHDVGKIYEEFAPLLRKEGKLTPDERMLMQRHPARSAELAATIAEFRGPVELAIRHHHENYDGTGYPDGVSGRAIPIAARIIMVADTLDAMTTDRPYRKALSFERTIEEFRKFSGKQFDPELVAVVEASANLRRLLGATEQGESPVHALGAWVARTSGPWRSAKTGVGTKVG